LKSGWRERLLASKHRVVGSGLRNDNLATLGPYPTTLEEQQVWKKRKAEVEAQLEAHLVAVRKREGLKEAWETWCYQEKLKALREILIHQQQQLHQLARMVQGPVCGHAPVQDTHQAPVQGAFSRYVVEIASPILGLCSISRDF
jgi:hypothetical protein